MSELCFAGHAIPRGASEPFWMGLNAYHRLPRVEAITRALEETYDQRHHDEKPSPDAAREGVLPYDARQVVDEHWTPILSEIESRLSRTAKPTRQGRSQLHNSGLATPQPSVPDERMLMELSQDWTDRSGCLGAALATLYGVAIGLDATRILEVGVKNGGSTRALLLAAMRTGGHLWSIDIEDRTTSVPQELHRWWTHIVSRSQEVAWDRELDLLFLDGEHSYEAVQAELRNLGRWVRPGGLIVMDDVWDLFPGVRQAFEEYADAAHRFYLPYGVAAAVPGGVERTLGVIRKL